MPCNLAAAPSQPARRRDPAGAGGTRGGVVEDKLQTSTPIDGSKADQIRLEGELKQIEQAR